jgi:hypothetical protein
MAPPAGRHNWAMGADSAGRPGRSARDTGEVCSSQTNPSLLTVSALPSEKQDLPKTTSAAVFETDLPFPPAASTNGAIRHLPRSRYPFLPVSSYSASLRRPSSASRLHTSASGLRSLRGSRYRAGTQSTASSCRPSAGSSGTSPRKRNGRSKS